MVKMAVEQDLPHLSLLAAEVVQVHKQEIKVVMVKQLDSNLQLMNQNKHILATVSGLFLLLCLENKVEVLTFKYLVLAVVLVTQTLTLDVLHHGQVTQHQLVANLVPVVVMVVEVQD